jgi:signal transduction histidine kinase
MSRAAAPDRITTREHRAAQLLCCLVIFTVALRRVAELNEAASIALALVLLGLFTVLFATESRLSRRYPWYPRVYFAGQFLLTQMLGIFRDYQDTWALLYTVLGIQAAYRCSRREALAWAGLFVGSTAITQTAEFGVLSGLGRASAFIVIGLFIVLYDSQYAQREDANEESRVLLEEVRLAHQKLAQYAARAEELAAARERDRILRELHDSVGQKVFAIQLATESTLLLLEKDPQRAAGQLTLLQEQTQSALDQMRQLIEEWKPM